MKNYLRALFDCPYCGKDCSGRFEAMAYQMHIVDCDPEDNGCGRNFIVNVEALATATVRKIEGEEDKTRAGE